MANAFQRTAFQHAFGFQGGAAAGATTPPVGGIGRHGRRRHHRITVEIDGEEFEVSSIQDGRELLLRARETAQEAATRAAELAAAKAAKKVKPAAVDRALAIHTPRIVVSGPDGSELLMQELRAAADAAQAVIDRIYAEASALARIRYAELMQDEEDVAMLLLNT